LHRKTNYSFKLFPQDGVAQLQNVYAENLEPTDENIRSDCMSTRLYGAPVPLSYGKPGLSRKEKRKEKFIAFTALGLNVSWQKESMGWWPFDDNWDKLDGFDNKFSTRDLHFHAAPECDDGDNLTERGLVQNDGIMNFIMEEILSSRSPIGNRLTVADDRRCRAAAQSKGKTTPGLTLPVLKKSFDQHLVDGFPVDRLDPPHSDVIIPQGRNAAQADYHQMEYAFRKICYRPCENRHIKSYEHFVLPKNLIAYFVQRLMQFKPETFGRFRIRDGSHTHIIINRNGTPRVRTVGETNHWLNELYQHNLQCDGANDIGLDVPVDDEDSSVTLVQNDDEDMDVGDIDFESINSCVEQPSDVPSQRGFYSDLVGEGYFDDEDMDVDDIDFESINTCVEQPSDVPSQGGFHSDLVGEGYFDDMDYEDYLEEQDCLDEAELIY